MNKAIGRVLLLAHFAQLVKRERKECSSTCSDGAGEKQEKTDDETGQDSVREGQSGDCDLQREGREIV